MTAAKTLQALGACEEARAWTTTHGGTLPDLWRDCPRGDWLLWYAVRVGAPREDLVRAAAACAELALPYAGETRVACEAAIAAARAWAEDPSEATRRAAFAAAAAAAAADAVADAAAAAAAADAAADAGEAARDEMHRRCADAVRGCVAFVEVTR